ncbi:MAG: 4Fe-4S binding protein [Bacillota bacterium]|nr:4Fe-4S binding protein [Bacillota bacterium]
MIRKVIHIDEDKCNGCGICANACHEGAIGMVDGKAKLLRDDYCDGMGDCLPVCPTGAITFEEREAAAYDEAAVLKNKAKNRAEIRNEITATSCDNPISQLHNWPVQIKPAPINAPYFNGAKLLIAADCTAYAYADFHREFMHNKVTLIGCPKLDGVDYSEKLTAILQSNDIQSVTIIRMEVPCCGGLEMATKKALQDSGKFIPWQVITISIDGKIVD